VNERMKVIVFNVRYEFIRKVTSEVVSEMYLARGNLKAIHPLMWRSITVKPTNGPSTQHILLHAKRQLHVSSTQSSLYQAVNRTRKRTIFTTAIYSLRTQNSQNIILIKIVQKFCILIKYKKCNYLLTYILT
jgi:hypothetical protein